MHIILVLYNLFIIKQNNLLIDSQKLFETVSNGIKDENPSVSDEVHQIYNTIRNGIIIILNRFDKINGNVT